MKIRFIAGVAAAALMGLAMPATAASPALSTATAGASVDSSVDAFYRARGSAPLWLKNGSNSAVARELLTVLQRAQLDGLSSGPALAAEAQALMARADTGNPEAVAAADRFLSSAWVEYVSAIQTPPAGMTYADQWVAPRRDSAAAILAKTAAAPSLAEYLHKVSDVNPIYAQLRAAAWTTAQANGGILDPRALASLERARQAPPQGRYVMVDTAGAKLYMIEDGRIADSMKVIVGKADPSTQTPMLASTIYYATLNPYWHVSGDMVRSLIARNVLDQGLGYLKSHGYQVQAADGSGEMLDPAKVDWRAVASGKEMVQVRQLPGPLNSMGRIKVGFPNSSDIYLHDTPNKALFAQDDRTLSHGCVRLEDAQRLGQWLLGRSPQARSTEPEQNVLLPQPVPIYVTYLTAHVADGQLAFVDDIYGRDGQSQQIAALR